MTKVGVWVHDDANARFLPTDLRLPFHPQGGRGNVVWRGSIYTSAGNSIYQFQAGSDASQVDVVGPDRDHGLPAGKRGAISALEGSHNDPLALLDASDASGVYGLGQRTEEGRIGKEG